MSRQAFGWYSKPNLQFPTALLLVISHMIDLLLELNIIYAANYNKHHSFALKMKPMKCRSWYKYAWAQYNVHKVVPIRGYLTPHVFKFNNNLIKFDCLII